MRPLKLEIHNFGPYVEACVDFEALNRELFLISGPTGSGKTTIFDAMCYGLYGVLSGDSRSGREMKSHFGEEENLAQVSFEFMLRERHYRILRIPEQQRKARRGDKLVKQNTEAVLYEVTPEGEQLLESTPTAVDRKILEMMGIDAGQFRQIVMLPQGEFSRMLRAKSDEREALLKSIFHMELYRRFGEGIDGRRRAAMEEKAQLSSQLQSEIGHLTAEKDTPFAEALADGDKTLEYILEQAAKALTEDKANVEKLTAEKEKEEKTRSLLASTLTLAEGLNKKFEEKKKLAETLRGMEEKAAAIDEKKRRVTLGSAALATRPFDERRRESRQRQLKNEEDCQKARGTLSALEHKKTEQATALKQVTDEAWEVENARLSAQKAVLERILEELENWKAKKGEGAKTEKALIEAQKALTAIEEKAGAIDALEKEQQQKAQALSEQRIALGELETAFQREENKRTTLERIGKGLAQIEKDLKEKEKLSEKWKVASRQLKGAEQAYNALLEKQRQESAAALAAGLEEGECCPVCGSRHHPQPAHAAAEGVTPSAVKAARAVADELMQERSALQAQGTALKEQIERQEKISLEDYRQIEGEAEALPDKSTIESMKAANAEKLSTFRQQKKEGNEKITALEAGIQKDDTTLKNWREALEGAENLRKETEDLQKQMAANVGEQRQINEQLQRLAQEIGTTEASVFEPEGDRALAAQKEEAEALILSRMGYKEKALEEAQKLETDIASGQSTLTLYEQQKIQNQRDYENAEAAFKAQLETQKLDLETYEKWQEIKRETIEALTAEIQEYERDLFVKRNEMKNLETELAGKEPQDTEALAAQAQRSQDAVKCLDDHIYQINYRIKNNTRQIADLKKKAAAIASVEKEAALYTRLYDTLAGKLPGKPKLSFERYILTAYLEDILNCANLFLDKMSGRRYYMKCAEDKERSSRGLEIEVFDNYTGVARSASTLSGGETFMAALSMALGLSNVVQAYAGGISLETIFIDEGFATLDEDALDKAINCLLSLREDGRVVGIISHVEELKERIDAKIIVEKTESGSHIAVEEGLR